jgi:TonB-linked SusC/RagA family outer membrane protein
MRFIAFHLLLCSVAIVLNLGSSESVFAQNDDKVTLSIEKASLQVVFSAIQSQTTYRFVYTTEQLIGTKLVTISANKESVQSVLKQCFRDQPLYFSLEDKFIIVHRKDVARKIETIDVSGKVKNEKGETLSGVTVSVVGSTRVTLTQADGTFSLERVPSDAILVFSGANVETSSITINGQSQLTVTLKNKINKLDEVQVIAYGSTTKRLNTGDVSTVTTETITEQPVSNPLAALEGRVAGLVVTQNSGAPGSGFFVQIRGQNSIANGNDPLYVIDGVPYPSVSLASTYTSSVIAGGNPLSTINPADIESINILKDADATSIYGSRGANGVILITTKRGKAGKTKVDFNTYFGSGEVDRTLKLLNTQQYLTMRNEAFKNDGATPSLSNGDYDLLLWDTTRYTDWQKLLIGNKSSISDVQLNISGGSSNTQFSLGGGFHRETPVFPGNYADQKGSAHFTLNHLSNDNKLKIDLAVTYGVENNNLPPVDFVSQAMSLPPDAPPLYDSVGKLNWPSGFYNPYSYLEARYQGKTNNLISHAVINYRIIHDLQIRIAMGYNNVQMNEMQINPLTSVNPAYNETSGYTFFSNSSIETWILEPQMEYQKQIWKGKLDFLIGATAEQDTKTAQTTYAYGFSSDALLENIAAASSTHIYNNNYSQYRYAAFFGRLNYNIGEKYILNLTGRRDGSSRFGPGNQFANFGSIGAAWIFSNEAIFKREISFLSFGKLRSSYGTTGNDQIGDYQYLSTYSPTPYPYQNAPGLVPTSLYNPDYAWEINKKFEVGLDLGFMKDRLLFSASYYNNHSSNQLVGYPLPGITGFGTVQQNLPAIVQNTGIELTLSDILIKTSTFSWNVSANISFPKNVLLSYPGLAESSYNNIYQVGKPLSIYKSFQYLNVNPQVGIYQFLNTQGTPTLSPVYPDDFKALKKVAVNYFGGLQNSLQYKGWRLDIFFQFTKQTGWNYIKNYYTVPGMLGNQPAAVMNRWQKPGDNATFQKFSQAYDSAYYGYLVNSAFSGDNTVGDASFIRLKTVSFSYTFSLPTMTKWHMQYLKLYLQGQNLLTISHYFGMDPENQSSYSLPPLRVITGGIQITF